MASRSSCWFRGRPDSFRSHRRRRTCELLEPRWTPTWAGIPPLSIAPPSSAVAIALNSQNDASGAASIATTEVDYFTFTPPVAGAYVVSALTPSSSVDTVLGVFSSSGQRLAYNDDISRTNTDSRLSVNLAAGARYYVGITNYYTFSRGSYTWAIDGPGTAPLDDAYENNDSLATAYNLGTLTASRTVTPLAMADSQDWFRFTMNGTGSSANSVSIAFQNAQGNLDLELYNSTGALLARSQGTGNGQSIGLNGRAAGTYYVRVYGFGGALNPSYSLTINPAAAPTTPTVDLVGSGLTVSNATAWGQTITVQASVRNGGNSASGAFAQQWYLSRDTVGSSDDVLLSRAIVGGTSYSLSGLAASTSSTFSVSLQLPGALPTGWTGTSFYVVMRTDAAGQVAETNESNNFGQAGVGLDNAPITIGSVPQTGGFQIQVNMTGLTVSQQAIFQQAANRWQQVIVGDLPNAVYRGQAVDDLLINASAAVIDGVNGILGQAGPDAFRSGSLLPYHGIMEFDSADLTSMESSGLLFSVVMHEMGHILGIGTIWSYLGLLSGAGTSNPTFRGSQATAAYNQVFSTNASGVPVENGGGPGTRDSHWRDSIFVSELMTGYAGPGTNLPLSIITVGSLADLGYQINYSAADPYTRPGSSAALASQSTGSSTTSRRLTAEGTIDDLARGLLAHAPTSTAPQTPSGQSSSSETGASSGAGLRESLSVRRVDALMANLASGYDNHIRNRSSFLRAVDVTDLHLVSDLIAEELGVDLISLSA